MTDYYNNQIQLEFGPVTIGFDLVPDHFFVAWVLDTSDTSISYSYTCNYTIFVQALFYNSMSADQRQNQVLNICKSQRDFICHE